jgi:molybdenum cofactor biosynthesis protein B
MGVHDHRQSSPQVVDCFVITVSDSRTTDDDESGALLRERLAAAGHRLTGYQVVRDQPEQVSALVRRICEMGDADVVLLNGGTGLSHRDLTHEALRPLLERTIDGFGELFRFLSYAEIGPAAMLSRALAGTCRETLIFAMPGSPAAVRLALDKLILPELGHAVRELRR